MMNKTPIDCACKRCGSGLDHDERTGGGRLIFACGACGALLYIYYHPKRVMVWPHEKPPFMLMSVYVAQLGEALPVMMILRAAA